MSTKSKKKKSGRLARLRNLSRLQMIAVVGIVAVIGTYLLLSAFAATAPAGTYTDIYMPGGNYYDLEHYVTVNQVTNIGKAPYFWSHQFAFTSGANGAGGYIGIQGINKAVFSVFGASTSTSSSCKVSGSGFDGGSGAGTSCIIPYTIQEGHTYRLRVWATGQDSNGGQGWGGWVTDIATNQEVNIGYITVPASWGLLATWSTVWTEYFGPTISDCSQLPYSNVTFSNFSANNGQYTQPANHNNHIAQTDCVSKSRITDNGPTAFVQEMGMGYQPPQSQPPSNPPPSQPTTPPASSAPKCSTLGSLLQAATLGKSKCQ